MGLNLVACDDSIKEAANKTGDPLTGDGGDTYEDGGREVWRTG